MSKLTVLITGASKGIGKAIADLLKESSTTYDLLTPSHYDLDLSCRESIRTYCQKHPNIDILINNAGINILGAVDSISDSDMDVMLGTNLIGPLALIREVVPAMKNGGYGKIVNISSIWGIRSKENRSLYSATKFALNGVTKALARELGGYNILVNSVCPGYVNTELTQKNVPQEEQTKIKATIPLGRFAEPDEIARTVAFLISRNNSYITGQTIIIDGGFLA
ncbi:MAG: SDR family oxidoreductase [Sulfuricurvum sp.]|jgi:3-oxoacyl-[acyl-carrier protein] reductase|uniref:SDR family NAD(P)-dependent oxidoreductase n=1 Tax=Sulfuricurvum sp. TaxID=2025608 RepID=UPI0025FEBA54|nr:SDR family oxidoreductase [Sulfuricurvum sp.]MCK9373407.1 SDR family oxidoreductase [Sulfuricurvum sp.]